MKHLRWTLLVLLAIAIIVCTFVSSAQGPNAVVPWFAGFFVGVAIVIVGFAIWAVLEIKRGGR